MYHFVWLFYIRIFFSYTSFGSISNFLICTSTEAQNQPQFLGLFVLFLFHSYSSSGLSFIIFGWKNITSVNIPYDTVPLSIFDTCTLVVLRVPPLNSCLSRPCLIAIVHSCCYLLLFLVSSSPSTLIKISNLPVCTISLL